MDYQEDLNKTRRALTFLFELGERYCADNEPDLAVMGYRYNLIREQVEQFIKDYSGWTDKVDELWEVLDDEKYDRVREMIDNLPKLLEGSDTSEIIRAQSLMVFMETPLKD